MPFDTTRVIHPDWSSHHRAAAEQTMTARVRIDRPDDSGDDWTPDGITTPPAGDPLWTGPARVQALASQMHEAVTAGQEVTTRDYLIALPADVPAIAVGDHGDLVTVTDCPDDPQLVDRVMRFVDIQHGSVLWQRNLVARDDLDAGNPTS